MHTKILIIGSGPAGCTAGIYAARANLNPVIIMGDMVGGQLLYTHKIENFPGVQNISGSELSDTFQSQISQLGVKCIYEKVVRTDLRQKPFLFVLSDGQNITADSVIIASGAKAKWLDIEGEEKFKGHGVSVCATCDGFFYRNKVVAVIGGGNTAVYEALFLSTLAQQVIVVNKNDQLSAEKSLCQKVMNNSKIIVLNNTQVLRIHGQDQLSGIDIKNIQTQEFQKLDLDGVFVAIGQEPETELFKGQLSMDGSGFIITDENKQTSLEGVFAAGDVQETQFRQAIVACSSGAIAAMSAEKYLTDSSQI